MHTLLSSIFPIKSIANPLIFFPSAAKVFATVLESADVRRRVRLLPEAAGLLFPSSDALLADGVVGVDEAYTCEGLRALRHRALTGCVCVRVCGCIQGRCMDRRPLHSLTHAILFETTRRPPTHNRVVEVARELSMVDDASLRFHASVDVEAVEGGTADAVALWFELDLVPPAGLPEEERCVLVLVLV